MNIVLTGFMGTGKSSVGRLLSQKLGWQYFDTDEIIEKQVGMKISKIFELKGEPYFRDVESKAIHMIRLLDNVVIACGGGVVLKNENINELELKGLMICLHASPEKIFERTKSDNDRPLLQVKDPVSKIRELLEKRKLYYNRCIFSVDTTDLTIEEVVDKILKFPKVEEGIK